MSRSYLNYFIFFGVVLSLLGGIHFYIWARFVRDIALPAPWRHVASAVVVLLAAGIPSVLIASRVFRIEVGGAMHWASFLWLGSMFIVLMLLLAGDIVRWVAFAVQHLPWGADSVPSHDPDLSGRRIFMARAVAATTAAVAVTLGDTAVRAATGAPAVKRVRVPLSRLPAELDGMTIVQLSDIHVGRTVRRDVVQRLVDQTNALEPDVIAITGDLVDGTVQELREDVAPLAQLKAKFGVYFVTGNHEYYSGVDAWMQELPRLGIRVLRNERVSVGAGPGVGPRVDRLAHIPVGPISIDLAGIDDATAHRHHADHGADLTTACHRRDPDRELVVLAHQPVAIDDAAAHGAGLMLSGHTHGGQIWPFGYLVLLAQPYLAGLARHTKDTWIYVSRGTGYWGPPMRLGAPSEITQLVLESPKASS